MELCPGLAVQVCGRLGGGGKVLTHVVGSCSPCVLGHRLHCRVQARFPRPDTGLYPVRPLAEASWPCRLPPTTPPGRWYTRQVWLR